MPETVGEAFVAIRPDTKGFAGDAEDGIRKPLLGIATAVGGAFAAIGLGKFIGDTISEATEAAKVTSLTNAVIKSTGEVANVSAKQVDELATSLSNKSGIDDEVIASGENVLLTFTNVRNEVGQGNDIFNQATGLALDMSRALGTDLQGSVIQLGKALNDPIAGITALSRVGVSFTEDQKNQIQGFIDANDLLSAQKVILEELAKEFGGAAEAAATPIDKLKVAIGNAKEAIGAGFLPVVQTLVDKLLPTLPAITDTLSTAFAGLAGPLADLIAAFAPFIKVLVDVAAPVVAGLGDAIIQLGTAFAKGLTPILEALSPILVTVAGAIADFFRALDAQDVLSQLGDAIGDILRALSPLAKVFGDLLVAIAPVIGALGRAFVHVLEALLPLIPPIVQLIKSLAPILTELAKALAPVIDQIGRELASAIKELAPSLPQLFEAFTNILKAITPLIPVIVQLTTLWIQLLPPLAELVAFLVGPLSEAINAIADVITFLSTQWGEKWAAIQAAAGAALEFLSGVWASIEGAIQDVVDFVSTAFDNIVGFFGELPGRILGALGDLASLLIGPVAGMMQGAINTLINFGEGVFGFFRRLPQAILDALGDLGSLLLDAGVKIIGGLIDGAKSVVNDVKDFFTGLADDIFSWKGPLDYDRRLLVPAGQAIMEGLVAGAESQIPAVESFFGGVGDTIAGALDLSFLGTQGWKDWASAGFPALNAAPSLTETGGIWTMGVNDPSPIHVFEDGSGISEWAYHQRWGIPWPGSSFKNGGFTNWPFEQARLVRLHGQELVLNRKQQAALGLLPDQAQATAATGDTFHIYAPNQPDPTWLAMEVAKRRRVATLVTNG